MQAQASTIPRGVEDRSAWGAVFALSLGAFVLVASEFMPVSLLTPIAGDLRITEGQAGQAIAVSGAFAVFTSLLVTSVVGRIDRRTLLLVLTAVMIVSGAVAALAQSYAVFMIARAFVGVAIGGFWSMSAAVAMRLVPQAQVPKALAVVNGGNALATVVAAPLGSFLGSVVGWRGAFFALIPVAAAALIWQTVSLPSIKVEPRASSANLFRLLKNPTVALGMAGVSLFFMGQFALFTYLRPFLETVTRVDVSSLSLILLLIGVAGFIGTTLIGAFIQDTVYRVLIVIPVAMAVLIPALIMFGGGLPMTSALLCAWGLLATSAPVGWWTWLSRTLPHDAEAGGGLMVAVVQLAITSGAAAGGVLFDLVGYRATFGFSAAMLIAAAMVAALTWRASRSGHR